LDADMIIVTEVQNSIFLLVAKTTTYLGVCPFPLSVALYQCYREMDGQTDVMLAA